MAAAPISLTEGRGHAEGGGGEGVSAYLSEIGMAGKCLPQGRRFIREGTESSSHAGYQTI